MAKLCLKKTSKRVPLRRKYKIQKKIREHNRKVRKEARKNPKRVSKDKLVHIPNLCPFKEDMLLELQMLKKKKEEEKKVEKEARKANRLKEKVDKASKEQNLSKLLLEAGKKQQTHEDRMMELGESMETEIADKKESMQKFHREFKKVVAESNVILQVLDARDPLGTRSKQVEDCVLQHADKRLVFVLNKADLIPRDNLNMWLKYLRQSFPTIPFKASTQQQRRHLSQKKKFKKLRDVAAIEGSTAVGADLLMSLLANYCRNKDVKTTITVGVVGMPNVGKSSLINSLKRSRSCDVGATPGVTKTMQEVHLDSKIKLLDCPGVVYSNQKKDESSCNALKNVVKVENLEDPTVAATAILRRVNREQMMEQYSVQPYSSPEEFFYVLAKRFGQFKKGGVPDGNKAARTLINDWNKGKLKYYTVPPEDSKDVHVSAEIVQTMAKEFDISAFEAMETNVIAAIDEPKDSSLALDVSKEMEVEAAVPDPHLIPESVKIEKNKKRRRKKNKNKDAKEKADIQLSLEGNQKLNNVKKLEAKKRKKERARRDKQTTKLAGVLDSISLEPSNNEDYDFNVILPAS